MSSAKVAVMALSFLEMPEVKTLYNNVPSTLSQGSPALNESVQENLL